MAKLDELRKYGAHVGESIGIRPREREEGLPAIPRREGSGSGERKGTARAVDVLEIEVDRIAPDPDQPRRDFDEETIDRMAASLSKHGQIMPIAVRWSESADRYVIVAGERRWRGAMKAGIATMKAVVRSTPPGAGGNLALQLVENLQREDLSPMDQARAYRRLMDENGWTGARLAAELEINHPRLVQALSLLELPATIQERVELEDLTPSGAYELSKIADPAVQEQLAAKVVEGQWTRDEIREEVRRATAGKGGARNPGKGRGGKSKAKVKTELSRADSGYKFLVSNRKGIDPATLREALLRWADQLAPSEVRAREDAA